MGVLRAARQRGVVRPDDSFLQLGGYLLPALAESLFAWATEYAVRQF